MLASFFWKIKAWLVYMTWHPVRDRTPEYADLIERAAGRTNGQA